MINDDDMFVVIIENDDDDECNRQVEVKPEIQCDMVIKTEVLDEDEMPNNVEDLLITAAEHGDFLEMDESDFNKIVVKSEYDHDNDFCIKPGDQDYLPGDDDYVPEDEDYLPEDEEFLQDSDSLSDEAEQNSGTDTSKRKRKLITKNNTNTNRRRKKTSFWRGTPREINSYVRHLRESFPDLKEDKELLITCIVEIMKQTQRPDPPLDYYIMNGIMFECVKCGAFSNTIPAAHRHYQEKHGERYLFCFACGADFRSTTNLYKHEKRCDAPDINIVLMARAQSLGRKGRSRPFLPDLSDIPPKKYYSSLQRFKCTECSASFVSKNGLLSHERMHRGERPFRCPHCPRAYTSRTTLSRHEQKHGDQEYVCDHCGRSFKLKAALVLHMDTHAPLKKFPCPECHKRYSQKSALLVHINRDHRKLPLPFGCKICPKRYPRMSVLKEHMKKEHGMLIMTRKMFFKQLPTLTDTQLQQAKVVLKSVMDPNNPDAFYQQDPSVTGDEEFL